MEELQKSNNQSGLILSSQLIPITKTADLLKAKPMSVQVREFGLDSVKKEIVFSINKCADSLNIILTNDQIYTLADDIIEVYIHDSIEDVIQCLKKGRQGSYGFGHNNRQTLNMIVIREWMTKHLEEKAIARESELSKSKDEKVNHEWKNRMEYEESVKAGSIIQDKIKESKFSNDEGYQKFKADYERTKMAEQVRKDNLEKD